MRTVLLANNRLGVDVGRYLADRGDLAAVVLHPEERSTHGEDLRAIGVPTATWPEGLDMVRSIEPEFLLSVLFAYLIPPEWLELATRLALNLHPGLLPFNRGACPNVWPLVDGSPAGTTLHVMDAEIDTGPILAQREVPTFPEDTALTLYRRLEVASMHLLEECWPSIGSLEPRPQTPGGDFHRLADLASLDPTEADMDLLNRLRARTFPPFGAEYTVDGRRYRIRVEIEPLD